MLAAATFWLLLCLPGYALLRRFAPNQLGGGLLSGVALGYLASFALLTPVSVAGYLFSLPLAMLSGAIVVLVLAACAWLALDLWRTRAWRGLRPSASALLPCLAAALIAADMVLGLRAGSYFTGDAHYHLARVRMLLTFGFNSWDPLAPGPRFDTVYHSNLYHALIASSGQLTRQYAPDVWAYAWFWAKLMGAAATYHLAWVMFGRHWLAWAAATLIAIFLAPSSMLPYPNSTAVYGLLPLALAFAVEAWSEERSFALAAKLGALAVVMVGFHALYYLFACLLAAPVLLLALARLRLRGLPGRRELIAALLALALGLPWFAVRAWPRVAAARRAPAAAVPSAPAQAAQAEPVAAPDPEFPEPEWSYHGFVRLPHGRLMLDPAPLKSPGSQYFQLLAALLAGLFSRRRSRFFALAIPISIALLVLYVPALCTAFDHAVGGAWVVKRLAAVFNATHLALFPGALVLLIAERLEGRAHVAWRALLQVGTFAGVLVYGRAFGINSKPWQRVDYLSAGRSGGPLSKQLARHANMRAFFARNIPRGATVAVPKS